MTPPPARSAAADTPPVAPSYEAALQELEQLVAQLAATHAERLSSLLQRVGLIATGEFSGRDVGHRFLLFLAAPAEAGDTADGRAAAESETRAGAALRNCRRLQTAPSANSTVAT